MKDNSPIIVLGASYAMQKETLLNIVTGERDQLFMIFPYIEEDDGEVRHSGTGGSIAMRENEANEFARHTPTFEALQDELIEERVITASAYELVESWADIVINAGAQIQKDGLSGEVYQELVKLAGAIMRAVEEDNKNGLSKTDKSTT
jgi:hypothetical protein